MRKIGSLCILALSCIGLVSSMGIYSYNNVEARTVTAQATFNEEEMPKIKDAIVYEINSQVDWDNLLSGVTDGNWNSGKYSGESNICIRLNCNITSGTRLIATNSSKSMEVDLNGYSLSSTTKELVFGSKGVSPVSSETSVLDTVYIHGGNIEDTDIGFGSKCTKVYVDSLTSVGGSIKTSAEGSNSSTKTYIRNCTLSASNISKTAISVDYSNTSQISNVRISGYNTGISYQYGTTYPDGDCFIKNSTIENCKIGINEEHCSTGTVVYNVNIIGNNNEEGSIGIQAFTARSSSEEIYLSDYADIRNCSISGYDKAVTNTAGTLIVGDTTISSVNNGLYSNGASVFMVKDSEVSGKESSNGYGIYSISNGCYVVNSTISGFNTGIYTDANMSYIVNSTLNNTSINIRSSCSNIYNCELLNAKVGVLSNDDTYSVVLNSNIVGNNEQGSSGVLNENGYTNIYGVSEEDYINKNLVSSSDSRDSVIKMISYAKEHDTNYNTKGMNISNYENGINATGGSYVTFNGVEINDCSENGILSSGTSLYGYKAKVSGCKNGVNCSGTLFAYDKLVSDNNVNIGVNSNTITGNNSSSEIESYGSKVGIYVGSNITFNGMLTVYDNLDSGLKLGNNCMAILSNLDAHDNGWNLYMESTTSQVLFTGTQTSKKVSLINSTKGNMFVDSNNAMFGTNVPLTIDNGEVFINNGLYKLASINPSMLNGVLVFNVPDEKYVEGTKVAEMPLGAQGSEDFFRTHYFAKKPGWVIKHTTEDYSGMFGSSGQYLELTEGCEVTYNYKYNGGTSWSGDFDKISYQKGQSIDLSLTASKEGFEFVGWNTDRNATVGLSTLEANTENVTLYAIYRKKVTINYITFDPSLDYSESAYIFNTNISCYKDKNGVERYYTCDYPYECDEDCEWVGYSFIDTSYDRMFKRDTIGCYRDINLYCVYSLKGHLFYKNLDGSLYKEYISTFNKIGRNVNSALYTYHVIGYPVENGYKFDGWLDKAGTVHNEGDIYETAGKIAEFTPVVSEIGVSNIVVTPKESTIYVKDSIQLSAKVSPDNALNQEIKWVSEDSSIAKVSKDGLVTGKKEGVVKIYAYSKDNEDIFDYAIVTVVKRSDTTTTENTTEVTTEKETSETSSSSEITSTSTTEVVSTEGSTEIVKDTPKTGDNNAIYIPICIGFLSMVGFSVLSLNPFKKKK